MSFPSSLHIALFKLGLQDGTFPHTLYKYTTINNLRLILEKQTIKFSKITEFNDVRECFAVLDGNCTKEEWLEYLKRNAPFAPKKLLENTAERIMHEPELAINILKDAISTINKNLGILCLAEQSDINLMWAHYASNHKGVCLEFDISQDPNTFFFPKKVIYDDAVSHYNYIRSWLKNGGEEATNAIFHKSSDWAYEKEWRIVRINGAAITPFNINALRTIIFGKNTPNDEIEAIKSLCREYKLNHIGYKQMELDSNTGLFTQKDI